MRRERPGLRRLLLAGMFLLVVLHQDFWWWDEPRRLLGLPIGLAYHVLSCLAAALLCTVLARTAWPWHLDDEAAPDEGRG